MSHPYTIFGSSSCKTNQMFRANVGSKDSRTNDIPRFAFSEQIILTIGTFHFFLIFLYGTINRPDYSYDSYSKYHPVEPDKFICIPIHIFYFSN